MHAHAVYYVHVAIQWPHGRECNEYAVNIKMVFKSTKSKTQKLNETFNRCYYDGQSHKKATNFHHIFGGPILLCIA